MIVGVNKLLLVVWWSYKHISCEKSYITQALKGSYYPQKVKRRRDEQRRDFSSGSDNFFTIFSGQDNFVYLTSLFICDETSAVTQWMTWLTAAISTLLGLGGWWENLKSKMWQQRMIVFFLWILQFDPSWPWWKSIQRASLKLLTNWLLLICCWYPSSSGHYTLGIFVENKYATIIVKFVVFQSPFLLGFTRATPSETRQGLAMS